jgi:ABC-type multidrug transport system permease subunit
VNTIFDALNKVDLWLSVLLAIPIGIGVNLVSPRILRWYEKRVEKSSKVRIEKHIGNRRKQLNKLELDIKKISRYHENRSILNGFILIQLIRILFISAFAVIYCASLTFAERFADGILDNILSLLVQIVVLMTSSLVFFLCKNTIEDYGKVYNYEKFKEDSDNVIKKLKEEVP